MVACDVVWAEVATAFGHAQARAVEALREHGAVRGLGLATWRLLRCNPFSNGGYDPVPPRHKGCEHEHGEPDVSGRV
jgi:putative component of membrane protein insertase Oxa1/YidC/SpoIIIJ protein YidD